MKLVPVPRFVPPTGTSHQVIVPADAVAPNIRVPTLHRELGVVDVITGTAFTVTVTDSQVELPHEFSHLA